MMNITPDELDAIEARADAAHIGPWDVGPPGEDGEIWVESDYNVDGGCPIFGGDESMLHNLEFAAHARTDVPRLVAEVRRLQAEIDRYMSYPPPGIMDCTSTQAQYLDENETMRIMIKEHRTEIERLQTRLTECERGIVELMTTFDPFDTLGNQPKRWTPTDHSEQIEFTDKVDPFNEDRTIARTRVKRSFEKLLDDRLDEMYGAEKE